MYGAFTGTIKKIKIPDMNTFVWFFPEKRVAICNKNSRRRIVKSKAGNKLNAQHCANLKNQ